MEANVTYIYKLIPKKLDELLQNEKILIRLTSILKHVDHPHVLLYGEKGSGKKTLLYAALY